MHRPEGEPIGRQAELGALRRMLLEDGARLVTLTGPAGVGKTTLALALTAELDGAPAFAGGTRIVDLAPLRDASLVLGAVHAALDPNDVGLGPPSHRTLRAALEGTRVLLVLDNFEHVLPAASDLSRLLEVDGLTLVVTSRSPLRLRRETVFPVQPLALPASEEAVAPDALMAAPAVQLFAERARVARPTFRVSADNAEAVHALVTRLDGLPLAIELMAVRAAQLGVTTVLDRLTRRLPVPPASTADAPDRHRSVEAAIAWSHDLLGPEEQRAFRRLAVFDGGWTVEAAEAVAGSPDDAASKDTLGALVTLSDQNLVDTREGHGSETRFAYLETVRQFALDRLDASGEADETRERHAGYYVELVARLSPAAMGPMQREWLAQLEAEVDNLRAALHWLYSRGNPAALTLASSLHYFWWASGRLAEGRGWMERAGDLPGADQGRDRAEALMRAAMLAYGQGDDAAAADLAGRAQQLARAHEFPRCEGFAASVEALAAWRCGDPDRALPLHDRAVALAEPLGIPWMLGTVCYHQGLSLSAVEPASAEAKLEHAADLLRPIGGEHQLLLVLSALAGVRLQLGKHDAVRAVLAEALPLARIAADPISTVELLTFALAYLAESGHRESALPLLRSLRSRSSAFDYELNPLEEAISNRVLAGAAMSDDAHPPPRLAELLDSTIALFESRPAAALTRSQSPLTSREHEVLLLMAKGLSNRAIADALIVSVNTAKFHVSSVLGKLGAGTRAEAVARAATTGLLRADGLTEDSTV